MLLKGSACLCHIISSRLFDIIGRVSSLHSLLDSGRDVFLLSRATHHNSRHVCEWAPPLARWPNRELVEVPLPLNRLYGYLIGIDQSERFNLYLRLVQVVLLHLCAARRLLLPSDREREKESFQFCQKSLLIPRQIPAVLRHLNEV